MNETTEFSIVFWEKSIDNWVSHIVRGSPRRLPIPAATDSFQALCGCHLPRSDPSFYVSGLPVSEEKATCKACRQVFLEQQ